MKVIFMRAVCCVDRADEVALHITIFSDSLNVLVCRDGCLLLTVGLRSVSQRRFAELSR